MLVTYGGLRVLPHVVIFCKWENSLYELRIMKIDGGWQVWF